MKTISIIILMLFASIVNAQFTVSFTPTGTTSSIESITATNVRTGQSVTFDGSSSLNFEVPTSSIESKIINYRYYPNPFNEQLTIEYLNTKKSNMVVYDISGKVISATSLSDIGNLLITFTAPSSGMYIIQIDNTKIKVISDKQGKTKASITYSQISKSNDNTSNQLKGGVFSLTRITGDIIKYTYKWKYSSVVSVTYDIPTANKIYSFDLSLVDIDGNVYKTIMIGNQRWMAENLKVTRQSNGDPIIYKTKNDWSLYTTNALYGWDADNIANKNKGALYNFKTVQTLKVCPSGWRVPTFDDLTTLIINTSVVYSMTTNDASKQLKAVEFGGSDKYGFNCKLEFPRVLRYSNTLPFTYFWSSNVPTSKVGYATVLFSKTESDGASKLDVLQSSGSYIRCIKD